MNRIESQDTVNIQQLLARYARAVDTKDWRLYRSVFTDDAVIDYASAGGTTGHLDQVVEWLRTTFATIAWSMHYITNIEVELDRDPFDSAQVRAAFYNPMGFPGLAGPSYFGGYYHHNLVRTPDGWRSRSLREETIWRS